MLFDLLIKRRFLSWRVRVFEHNPANATSVFGLVFCHWHERLAEKMKRQPWELVYDYMERGV